MSHQKSPNIQNILHNKVVFFNICIENVLAFARPLRTLRHSRAALVEITIDIVKTFLWHAYVQTVVHAHDKALVV